MVSTFRNAIQFLDKLGVYDVLLPFILVFAIVYAILEKTKVLGTESKGDVTIPRRNLNSLVAFSIAFFVVASSRIVATLNKALAHIVVLLVAIVAYLMLIGAFHKEGEPIFLDKGWKTGGMIIMLIGIVLIFANSIPTDDPNVSWLEWLWAYVVNNWNGTIVGTIVFLIIIIVGMIWITRSPAPKKSESGGD